MKTFLKTFLKDESGASAAEYALILAIVGVAIGGASLYLADTIKVSIEGAGDRVLDCAKEANDASGTDCVASKTAAL